MGLFIDGSGGFAGDMFTSALIDAGADPGMIIERMTDSGRNLGRIHIVRESTRDEATRLRISLLTESDHVTAGRIRELLAENFEKNRNGSVYREFGFSVLDILIKAENLAHSSRDFHEFHHHHGTGHGDTFLHEAQDILVDIVGAVSGLESLEIDPSAVLLSPLVTGKGKVRFSHGLLDIPAPATRIILEDYHIEWSHGDIDSELCTPTGASLLAALIRHGKPSEHENIPFKRTGASRGSKELPIPPLKIYLD